MAYKISGGLVQPSANVISAHNEDHRSNVALEAAKPHYDASEWDTTGLEEVLSRYFSSALITMQNAIDCTEKSILLWDTQHSNMHNGGNGKKIFAHKIAGTLVGGTVGPAGSVLETDMVTAWAPIAIDVLTKLKNHLTNVGGTWHTTADTFNVVSVPAAITTKQQLWDALLHARAVYEQHRVYGVGSVHVAADNTNTISAEPPDTVDDWDKHLALLQEIALDLVAHGASVVFHANAHVFTITAAAFPASVSTAFTRLNTYKSTHNADLASATIHDTADATNNLAAANATTVATYITLAEEVRTKQSAHFRNAPTSAAMRGV